MLLTKLFSCIDAFDIEFISKALSLVDFIALEYPSYEFVLTVLIAAYEL
jgi:hypothetical protein